MQKEIWKTLPGFDYDVSSFGNVRSHRNMKNLKPQPNSCGYMRIMIGSSRLRNRKFIHRLVAELFCENPKGKKYVNHKNGIKDDNRACNLEWVTQSENCKHAHDNGLSVNAKGENSPRAKLKNYQVRMVCAMLNDGMTTKEIGDYFGVNRKTISDIKLRKTWNSVTSGILKI